MRSRFSIFMEKCLGESNPEIVNQARNDLCHIIIQVGNDVLEKMDNQDHEVPILKELQEKITESTHHLINLSFVKLKETYSNFNRILTLLRRSPSADLDEVKTNEIREILENKIIFESSEFSDSIETESSPSLDM